MPSKVVLIRRVASEKVTVVGLNLDEEDHLFDAVDVMAKEYGYDVESIVSTSGQPFTMWMVAQGAERNLQGQLFEWIFEECQRMKYAVEHD